MNILQNLLGEYSKYVSIASNGNIQLTIPQDINDLTKGELTTVEITQAEAPQLLSLVTSEKSYSISDGTTTKVLKEGDAEFDMNKWIKLAIRTIKNNK